MRSGPARPVRDFAAKLRLTAAALGCTSQKELAMAFRRADPASAFDLTRSYKWTQGRTLPRSAKLFEEWAALLGLGRSAEALLACSLEEFRAWLAEHHGPVPPAGHAAPARPNGRQAIPAGGPDLLEGDYACYSHAQSPYFRGRVIRSSLTIGAAPRRGSTPVAHYVQAVVGGVVRISGPLRMYGQTPCLEMHGPPGGAAPVFVTLFRPTPPCSVLAGIMLSFTLVDPDHQPPYATRFVAVRVPAAFAPGLETSNRYMTEAEWPPSADLAALGLAVGHAPELDGCLEACLTAGSLSGSDRIPAEAFARLTRACDRAWLASAEATADASVPA